MAEPGAFKNWAKGVTSTAKTADQLDEEVLADEAMLPDEGMEGDEDALMGASHSAIWYGELDPMAEEVSEEDAMELMDYLEGSEPEIYDALVEYASAAAGGDTVMLDHGREEMMAVVEQHDLEAPEFDEAQREAMMAAIDEKLAGSGMADPDDPQFQMMLADAVCTVRCSGSLDDEEDFDEEEPLDESEAMPSPDEPAGEEELF